MPAENEARIPIPIVGGLDDSTDPLALRPPSLAASENTRINRKGSVSKRPAWGGILATTTGSALVVANRDRVLAFGGSGASVVDPVTGTITAPLVAPGFPVAVERVAVAPGDGYVHAVQAASSENYTCVVWSYVGTVGGQSELVEQDFRVAGAILDADLRVVWGPHDLDSDLKWLPRVEPVGDGQFAVFAVGNDSPAFRDALDPSEIPNLYACRYDVDTAPGASVFLGTMLPGACQIYDTTTTYPDLETNAAFVVMNRDNGGREVRILSFLVAPGTPLDTVPVETDPHDVAIHWDGDTTTILIYEGGDKLVYYTADVVGGAGGVAAPTLAGLTQSGAAVAYSDDTTNTWENRPVFYTDPDGDLYLNEVPVTLTGSAPATPSFGAAETERCLFYEPKALAAGTVFARAGSTRRATQYKRGVRAIDTHIIRADGSYGALAPLGESRHGDPGHTGYTWTQHRADNSSNYSDGPRVTGQVAARGTKLLFPMALLTGNQNARGHEASPVDLGDSRLWYKASPNAHAGAGFYNDEQTVCLVTVEQSAAAASAVPFGGRRLVAAGGTYLWSGDRVVQPIALRAPGLGGFTDAVDNWDQNTSAGREVSTEALGVRPDVTTGTGEVKFNGRWWAKAGLVVTDADGTQYRSPLSNRALGWQGADEDDVPDPAPCFVVLPPAGTRELLDAGFSVDVELFTTERGEGAATGSVSEIDESTYVLACRMPLQEDANGFYVLDTMADYARYNTAGLGWGLPVEFPVRNAQAMFTLSGELEPQTPPASGVVARAGEHMFLVPSEYPAELWASKPLVAGRIPEFHPLLTVALPPEAGTCVSLGGMYDRLILLTTTGVYELPAIGGPLSDGTGSFPPMRLSYQGDPCVSHRGTVSTPLGVFYVSRTGPKLVGPDGSPSDIGAPVRSLLDWSSVVGAVYNEAASEVIWYDSDYAAVLNTLSGAWSTHDLLTQSADYDAGRLYRINQAGVLRAEDPTSVLDGSAYPMATVSTAWFDSGDPQGFKRLDEIVLLGRLDNTPTLGKLIVDLAYDYDDTVVDTHEWDWADVPVSATGTFRLRVHPSRGKIDAVKITVREDTTTVGQTTGNDALWTLANVEARVRGKDGLSSVSAESSR